MRITTLTLLTALVLGGCGKSDTPAPGASAKLPEGLMLTAAPGDAKNLIDVKTSAKEGDIVTIKAVVGGTMNPFVGNRGIVQVLDPRRSHAETCQTMRARRPGTTAACRRKI